MSIFLFDTSALIALRDKEPGSQRVAELLVEANNGAVNVTVASLR